MLKKAWIVSVNMGYGHQRTAFPLRDLAPEGKVIQANDYSGIPEKDRKIWRATRIFYEFISRFRRIPLAGKPTFFIFDRFQRILDFYPKRDLSKPSFQLKQIFSLIEKGWGEHLIKELKEKSLPLVTTFFTPAFMAEHFKYPGEIFCVVCDADVSRTWASLNPKKSRIKYFVPTERVAERLALYGVRPKNIFLTGYPLPAESPEDLKKDLGFRLLNLDSKKRYLKYYEPLITKYVGRLPGKPDHPFTLTFAVGGAGAQKEIGVGIVKNLAGMIKNGRIKIILVAGIRNKVRDYFFDKLESLGLAGNKNVEVLFDKDIDQYFQKFNEALKKTDVLWTKPSELSFYSALGLPIILAPSIGSQEEFNRRWLLKSGFGFSQGDPSYTSQWLFDWLDQGYLAEAAMQGFIEGEKSGTLNIQKIISGR
ncbi:MAG: hypothetical protein Q8P74_00390 [bacterium]|nr:hypothetical protein [bacterium]